ncbi:MAG: actin family protein [Candidatus Lokiarchaeota archaeon]|nr:actin family protein [Candidatus Lokiarchaeota archaeon]
MTNITIVLDIGEFSSKIGFAGENEPRNNFYSLVGEPKYQDIEMDYKKQYYVGNEISSSIGLYKIHHPIIGGRIEDWNFFEQILDYVFYTLRIDPSIVNVLYSYHPMLSTEEKRRLFELFFDKYQVMGFYPILDSLLTMYSGGFQTGLVVEMGASSIRIVPIYQGYMLSHAIEILQIGGTVLDTFMYEQLQNAGFSTDSSVRREIGRVLKERACFVSLDYNQDKYHVKNKEFRLPDGSMIELGIERFTVPELLFKPALFNLEEKPLHTAILDVIDNCDLDTRNELLENIFLSGGTSIIPQLEFRLQNELEIELAQRGKEMREPRIIAPKQRFFSCWIGGSILSSLPDFQKSWVTRPQYYKGEIPEDLL